MQDTFEPKIALDGERFTIQYMHRYGYSSMSNPHYHPVYEIYYLMKGERVYFMNGQVYTLQQGDIIVINPNDLHSTSSSEIPEFERILINFSSDFLAPAYTTEPCFLPFEPGSRLIRFPLKEREPVDKLFLDMLTECREQQEGYAAYVRALLSELLIRIRRHCLQTTNETLRSEHPMHQKVTEIASFLNLHYNESLTLEQVAGQFYISPSYLSRIFSKITGYHFREYIQVVRIKEAQRAAQGNAG
ncbi:AraC family transcriptional regulator [Paenibacillus sp. P26]|nr:AraC family transcriptional regulator [Paenibacillus sp. P26]